MNEIDDHLRRALRRVDPPDGFADRVRERAALQTSARPPLVRLGRERAAARRVRWAVAAMLAAAVGGGVWYRAEERQRQAGDEARRQVLLSLRIAGSKLRAVELQVNRGEERQ